jgi:amino acid transporter
VSTPPDGGDGEKGGRFGTFGGVFTPSILTILGVVMYMRLGWATGQAGLGGMLTIVAVAHLISLSTGLSIASIATNRTVGAGGAYFMISRALGAPAGAAIGIPLFFAQALSVTFYIVGFTESLFQLMPPFIHEWVPQWAVSTAINVGLTALSLKSAELAIKAQYVVMGAIVLSLVAFFTGQSSDFPREIEWFNSGGEDFSSVFAVFFPAVTGIMAGVGMSGDLKDPRRSIPRGTLAAIFIGWIIYSAFPVWLALNASNEFLVDNLDSVFQVSSVSALIYVGVWGATLSSALGSILTAPRTLQAVAMDGLLPRFLGRGSGPDNEPRLGLLISAALAQTGIMLGSLDAIAPVLTMFFLATYGFTNLACGLQKWAASPSFRPSFRVPAGISLLGGLACFYVMSIIDLRAMVAALVICGLIYAVQQRRALGTTYGDARHGIWAALVRSSLQRLRRVEWHPLNWRPNLVIMGGNPNKRPHLLKLGNVIVQDRGIVTFFHLLRGTVWDSNQARKDLFNSFEEQIADRFPNVFYRVDIVDDVYQGTVQVAQSYGVGSFEANSVMLGWTHKSERNDAYVQMLRDLTMLDKSLLLVKWHPVKRFGQRRLIHIWWGGLQGNGGLMLLLAFLITANYRWRNARVEVLTVVETDEERRAAEQNLKQMLQAARLDAKGRVVLRQRRSIQEVMHVESDKADLAIVGIRLPEQGEATGPFFERMNTILNELPTTIMVHSSRDFESERVLFDD